MSLPSEPITRKEQYLAKAAGQDVEIPAKPITREEEYLDAIAKKPGGGGGTSDYSQLENKPQINGVTLSGDKSASDLGLVAAEEGKGLSENNYTDADKEIVGGVTGALAGKQDTLTFDDTPTDGSNNPVKSNGIYDALATKADLTDLAPAFSTETAYAVGKYVSYGGDIYKCTSAHSAGAWVAGDFTLVAVGSELESKQNATDNNLQTTNKTVVGGINEVKSGLIDSAMIPVNTTTLGTIATNESQKTFIATKNGYVTVDSGNVGATNPTVTCSIYQIARNYGAATTVTIASYTGVKFCTIPVKAGDGITVDISGHTVDAEVLQISYS